MAPRFEGFYDHERTWFGKILTAILDDNKYGNVAKSLTEPLWNLKPYTTYNIYHMHI